MGYVNVSYVISTVTCYALTTELWLPETFVITMFVQIYKSYYGLSQKFISLLPVGGMCGIYETHKYYAIMNAIIQ